MSEWRERWEMECTALRRIEVKEHFRFAVLRDSEIDDAMK